MQSSLAYQAFTSSHRLAKWMKAYLPKASRPNRDRTCPPRTGLPWQKRPLVPSQGIGDTGVAQIRIILNLPQILSIKTDLPLWRFRPPKVPIMAEDAVCYLAVTTVLVYL
jgi:hypothetical protein